MTNPAEPATHATTMCCPAPTSPGLLKRPPRFPPLLVLGLTGGIASGKSTVAAMLSDLGAEVISADEIGREVVAPGEPALAEIIDAFGPSYLLPTGGLNRRAVAGRVFGHPSDLAILDRITHPRISALLAARLAERAARARKPRVVVVEAAILIEAGWSQMVDRIAVVHAQHSTQVARLMAGLGLAPSQAEARVRSQLPLSRKLRHAHYRIDGEAALSQTQRQVKLLWRDLNQAARLLAGQAGAR